MTGRAWIIGAIISIVILLTIVFVNQNQKKSVVVTVSHPTPTVAIAPTTAGQSATTTLETQAPSQGPTHIIITATPEVTPTGEPTPTP